MEKEILILSISHDIARGQTCLSYLTENEKGEPLIIGELMPFDFSYSPASAMEIFHFWASHPYTGKTPLSQCLVMTVPMEKN